MIEIMTEDNEILIYDETYGGDRLDEAIDDAARCGGMVIISE